MTVKEYNKCVDANADMVYRFILKNIRDEEKARDIVQDAFTKLWEKVKNVSFEKSKSYLYTSAYNRMIDVIRKEKRMTLMEDGHHHLNAESNGFSDVKEILDEAVEKLPEVQKHVLLLRDYEGYSYKEIGEITGLNESQVKVYIFRARMTLKEYIGCLDSVL